MAQVGDDNAPPDYQGDVHRLQQLLVGKPRLHALDHVIVNAIVAAQHHARRQAEQLLRPGREGTILISHRVQVEETLKAEMPRAEDALVHSLAISAKFIQAAGHGHVP